MKRWPNEEDVSGTCGAWLLLSDFTGMTLIPGSQFALLVKHAGV